MKQLLICILLILSILTTGCGSKVMQETPQSESMFVVVESVSMNWLIVYHKETKVMYAVSHHPKGSGVFTVLVDENGKPMLWEGE